jgi:alkaline phosphatase
MKPLIKLSCLTAFSFVLLLACKPARLYTTADVHSHNDYMNDMPFRRAFNNRLGSIEADVFPVNGVLVVAHSKKEIEPSRTLKGLYLEPLLKELAADPSQHVRLLIDIKENYQLSLSLLVKELAHLKPYLSTPEEGKAVVILISGSRPTPAEYKNYPPYIFFDDDLKLPHDAAAWQRVGLVSLQFSRYSAWKGESALEKKDRKKLKHTIDSVHLAGKAIRFWGAPDNEKAWKTQMKLGVDLIGTDKIDEISSFLRAAH